MTDDAPKLTDSELLALCEAATGGPWEFDDDEGYGLGTVWAGRTKVAQIIGDSAEADAVGAFIAAARSAMPRLLAEKEALRKAIEHGRSVGDRLARGIPVSRDEIRQANAAQEAAIADAPTEGETP